MELSRGRPRSTFVTSHRHSKARATPRALAAPPLAEGPAAIPAPAPTRSGGPALVARGEEWWEAAACRGKPVDTFFTGDELTLARALVLCHACPVRGRCLDYAVRNGIAYGIWGGATETERRMLRPGA